jgi:hypothetical protein
MSRNHAGKNGALRERIAHLAARIIAEDGIDDFAYAKRKAARQAGAADARAMPDNDEVEEALAEYREIYQKDEHPELLAALREQALTVMQALVRFQPYLTGSVLSGAAGKFADIEIHLFADSGKEVEMFLLNQGWRFRPSQARCFVNQSERQIPAYVVMHEGIEAVLKVFDLEDTRATIRSTALGRPHQRAGIQEVQALVEGES